VYTANDRTARPDARAERAQVCNEARAGWQWAQWWAEAAHRNCARAALEPEGKHVHAAHSVQPDALTVLSAYSAVPVPTGKCLAEHSLSCLGTQVLILDEATSALDTKTERSVQAALHVTAYNIRHAHAPCNTRNILVRRVRDPLVA
jgi:hypothetical protein